jgi:hypothetical protein
LNKTKRPAGDLRRPGDGDLGRLFWYNTSKLMHTAGRGPPVEAEADYYAHHDGPPK